MPQRLLQDNIRGRKCTNKRRHRPGQGPGSTWENVG